MKSRKLKNIKSKDKKFNSLVTIRMFQFLRNFYFQQQSIRVFSV